MKFTKTLILLSSLAAGEIAYNANAKITEDSIWEHYWDTASHLNKDIDSANFEKLAKLSTELTELATQMLPNFVKKQPICREYLGAVIKAADIMQNISLEEIERDYHADNKLPAIKDASCYHAKDLLVHPATISIILRTLPDTKKHREMLHQELDEVFEHFKQVKDLATQER